MGDSRSVASAEPPEMQELFFSQAFTISGQICLLLKAFHHLANFRKVYERFSDVSSPGCVLSLSKMDDLCQLKCLAGNAIPS